MRTIRMHVDTCRIHEDTRISLQSISHKNICLLKLCLENASLLKVLVYVLV